MHSQIDEILSISLDIKENALQARKSCGKKRQTELEYCHENREKIDSILSDLRQELRTIMSGVKKEMVFSQNINSQYKMEKISANFKELGI